MYRDRKHLTLAAPQRGSLRGFFRFFLLSFFSFAQAFQEDRFQRSAAHVAAPSAFEVTVVRVE